MQHNFDIAALNYDTDFTYSNIGIAQRMQVYRFLKPLLADNKPLNILELNCGTGIDAKYINTFGHKVLATDISTEMLKRAEINCKQTSVKLSKLDISEINLKTFKSKFDLIFSNFGGLNCLSPEELSNFLAIAPSLLNDKGKMVMIIMPKHTIWERLYFYLKGNKSQARRRDREDYIIANVENSEVKTWYYNPNRIVEYATNFRAIKIKPIGLWVPPSYLETSFLSKKTILKLLNTMDRIFHNSRLSKYSDHFYIELQKK